ncbi:DUF1348 family protein [Calothrix sp. PCC 6303]
MEDSEWRNRAEFFRGRDAIKEFLKSIRMSLFQSWLMKIEHHLK